MSGRDRFRVCHVISGDLLAGAEVMDYQLLKILKQYGDLDFSAIHLNEGSLADGIRSVGIPADAVEETGRGVFRAAQEIGGFREMVDDGVEGSLTAAIHGLSFEG